MTSSSSLLKSCTAVAPTNLALIKYWGKRDTVLNLPINSSISVTLDHHDLQTITTVTLLGGEDDKEKKDRLWVNGEEVEINSRATVVLQEMRELCPHPVLRRHAVMIVSRNSFPTAAGLASSAAGYCAMVMALAGVFDIDPVASASALTRVARRGSGSACRSLFGGIVAWNMGIRPDGLDSEAVQIAPVSHWNDLEAIICVASDHKKSVSSTAGMQTSVQTSKLLAHRATVVVPARFMEMIELIKNRKDDQVLELTMRDSNQFHACCLDTFPPIFYMTDVSRRIVRVVEELNALAPHTRYGYTFDAGPNAVIFCSSNNTKELLNKLLEVFRPTMNDLRKDKDFLFVRGRTTLSRAQVLDNKTWQEQSHHYEGDLMYIFHTGIGQGAHVLSKEDAQVRGLADAMTGLPKT